MKTMKRANSVTVTLSATLLFCAVSAVASQPEIIDLPETLCCCPEPPAAPECTMLDNFSEKLARIEARIGELTLELNRLVWETYFDYAEQACIVPDIMTYPGLDYSALCDTVSAIAVLDAQYRKAADVYTKVLKSDPKYDAIHREYVALQNVDDKDRKNANREQYNLMYDRLRRKNSEYAPALKARQDALRARNIAVARFLLNHYQAEGRVMPVEPLFKRYSETMRTLQIRDARIEAYENELSTLQRLRREVLEQVLREQYDVPKRDAVGASALKP
mgnify:FL=1